MTHKLRNKFIALGLLLAATTAYATPEDRDLAISGRSNEKTINTSTGLVTMTGMVFLTQGNLEIYADYTELETNQATKQLEYLIAKGEPARFIDLPTIGGEKVQVSGLKIEFLPAQDLIITTGGAKIEQNGNIVLGQRIEYNTLTGVMKIESLRAISGNPDDAQAEMIILPGAID